LQRKLNGHMSRPSHPPVENRPTVGLDLLGGPFPGTTGTPSPRHAWALAVETDSARPFRCARGYRLYAIGADGTVGRDLPDEPGAFVVLGRHTRCDLVIRQDETVSLRHLLFRLQNDAGDAEPGLRVLDLRTQMGFSLPDGTRRRSILVRGPVLLKVGPYWVAGMTGEAPSHPDPPASVYELPAHPYRQAPDARMARPYERPQLVSRITLMPAAAALGEPRPAADGLHDEYALELESAAGVARVGVRREEIERGFFVGRSERCEDPRLRGVLSAAISRVHLLIIRVDDRIIAYDVASTSGTRFAGHGVRAVELCDRGTELVLAHQVRMRWRVRPSCAP
jgi:hypothetical protein